MKKTEVQFEMTRSPIVVDADQPLVAAQALMEKYRIRHLPVMRGSYVVGLVTERALKSALLSKWADRLTTTDIMLTDPYRVPEKADINDVVDTMIDKKIGSVLVVKDSGDVAGIFTTFDALRMFRRGLAKAPRKRATTKRALKVLKRAV